MFIMAMVMAMLTMFVAMLTMFVTMIFVVIMRGLRQNRAGQQCKSNKSGGDEAFHIKTHYVS